MFQQRLKDKVSIAIYYNELEKYNNINKQYVCLGIV